MNDNFDQSGPHSVIDALVHWLLGGHEELITAFESYILILILFYFSLNSCSVTDRCVVCINIIMLFHVMEHSSNNWNKKSVFYHYNYHVISLFSISKALLYVIDYSEKLVNIMIRVYYLYPYSPRNSMLFVYTGRHNVPNMPVYRLIPHF